MDPADYADVQPFHPDDPGIGAPDPGRAAKRFPIVRLDDIHLGNDPIWLIEGLLPATGFGIVFGPPKSLKSFLLSDALFHVAMGKPWMERETMSGPIVYVTGEGVEGFKRRLIAMRRHYGVEGQGTPFLLIPVAPDLGHASGDAEVLVETIREYLATIGNPPVRAVAIDTLARTMRGADENAAKDMSTFVDNCGKIGDALSCIVIGVHHAGKDATKGSRGSNALDGAVDVMWSIEKGEASSTATIHYMKEAEPGLSWQFRLVPFTLEGGGARERTLLSAVVEIVDFPGKAHGAARKRTRKLGVSPGILLDVIVHAIGDAGIVVRGDPNVPHDVSSIPTESLKKYLPLKGYWDNEKSEGANRAMLSRDLKALVAAERIGRTADYVWLKPR